MYRMNEWKINSCVEVFEHILTSTLWPSHNARSLFGSVSSMQFGKFFCLNICDFFWVCLLHCTTLSLFVCNMLWKYPTPVLNLCYMNLKVILTRITEVSTHSFTFPNCMIFFLNLYSNRHAIAHSAIELIVLFYISNSAPFSYQLD